MGEILGSIVGGATSLAGAAIQNKYNQEQAAQARQWEEQMMNKQNEWSLNMWNAQNEYNSPEQQLQRLRDAGLNPMFYGLDGTSADGLVSATNNGVTAPQMTQNPLSGLADTLSDRLINEDLKSAQVDLMKSEARKNNSEADDLEGTRTYRINLLGQEYEIKSKEESRAVERHIKEIEALDQEIKIKAEQNDREWKKLDLDERIHKLEKDKFELDSWLKHTQMDNEQKRLLLA